MCDMCCDDRFELIGRAKDELFEATNINDSPEEVAVLDDILFRFYQMGWLDRVFETRTCTLPKPTFPCTIERYGTVERYGVAEMCKCSACGAKVLAIPAHYCPNCGRRVVE